MSNNETREALAGITLGSARVSRNLSIFPVLGAPTHLHRLLMLGRALRQRSVTLSEVSAQGSVPRVLLENRAELPVLLLDGDHLVGCKQNRVLNISVLAPANAKTELPVSCVEQGRWHSDRHFFDASARGVFAELRAEKMVQVSRSLSARSSADANQGAVWESISRKSERLGSVSHSGAMEGIYARCGVELDTYLEPLCPRNDERGAAFAINGQVVGLELLPTPNAWAECGGSVISGYALDALDHFTAVHPAARRSDAQRLVDRIGGLDQQRFPGIGLGENVRLGDDGLAGMALVHDGALVHLCAFELRQGGPHAPGRVGRTRGGGHVY